MREDEGAYKQMREDEGACNRKHQNTNVVITIISKASCGNCISVHFNKLLLIIGSGMYEIDVNL